MKQKGRRLLGLPALLLIASSAVIPLVVLATSVVRVRDLSAIWSKPGVRDAIFFSTWQALASTFLTLALGLFPAWILTRYQFRGRHIVVALMTVPFVLPTVAVGAAFLAVLPPALHRSTVAILLAHVFFNISIVVRTVGPLWGTIDEHLLEAARSLGASPSQIWRRVILPIARPAIWSSGLLTFLMCFTSYGIVTILGGPGLATLDREIYRRAVPLGDLSGATILAVAQTAVVGTVFAIWTRRRNTAMSTIAGRSTPSRRLPAGPKLLLALMSALFVAPILALVVASFRAGGDWSTSGWKVLFGLQQVRGIDLELATIIRTSVVYAVLAMAIAVPIGIAAAQAMASNLRIDSWTVLPLATSPVVVGLGILVTYDHWPVDFRSSWFLIPVVHASIAVPFVVRSALPVVQAIPHDLRSAASTLGAGPWRRFFAIDWPLLRPAVSAGLAFSFAMSIGEFGATSFLTRRDSETLPISIASLFGKVGEIPRTTGMAASVLLLVLVAGVVLVIDRRSQI